MTLTALKQHSCSEPESMFANGFIEKLKVSYYVSTEQGEDFGGQGNTYWTSNSYDNTTWLPLTYAPSSSARSTYMCIPRYEKLDMVH